MKPGDKVLVGEQNGVVTDVGHGLVTVRLEDGGWAMLTDVLPVAPPTTTEEPAE